MITGIVVALPEELATLTSQKVAKGGYLMLNNQLVVAYSGAGAVNDLPVGQEPVPKH